MKILFVCTHNACRSVLAEITAQQLSASHAGEQAFISASAGSHPAGSIHPLTLGYLKSLGIATDSLRSEGLEDYRHFFPDLVIAVCDRAASEPCPVWLGDAAQGHWGLPDPSRNVGDAVSIKQAFDELTAILRYRLRRLLNESVPGMSKSQLEALVAKIGDSNELCMQ